MMGDGDPEVFEVLSPQVNLPFDPLPRELLRLPSAGLSEVVQLSSDLSMASMELG